MPGWVSVSLICAFLRSSLGGGNTSGLTVARVARGDGTGLGAIRGGDQVMLCLPDPVSGPGDGGGWNVRGGRAVKECGSPGGCFSGLCLSRARIASVLVNECWDSPALPGPPVHTSSGSGRDASERGVTIVS